MTLNSLALANPDPLTRSSGIVKLKSDGSNIAEFLLDIRKRDEDAFEGILETLQNILPHVKDLQSSLTAELDRSVHFQLTERKARMPGWLLSTGAHRILALLALLRHPSPPSLIVIEEIENSFDPRTLHFIVEEIRYVIEEGISQVIFTTHSPYLLD